MSTPANLDDVVAELVAIRLLLTARPVTAISSADYGAKYAPSTASSSEGPPPQPTEVITDPGTVTVHFGKNNGKALADLGERSLLWYATEQPPRLDSSGKPYPPRQVEITLRNAARTLWHTRAGTLGAEAVAAAPVTKEQVQADEQIPF